MAWTGLTLTVDGRNALTQAQTANRMNIKSVVVGDGEAPQNFRTMKKLVHQLYEVEELKVDVSGEKCVLTVDFPKVDYDYYYREIGVVVTTDEGDVLYAYDNCGDDAQYIVNSTGVEETRKRIRISLIISDVVNVTVSSPSLMYVGYDEFEKEVEELRQAKEDIVALQDQSKNLGTDKVDRSGDMMTGELWARAGTSVLDMGPYQDPSGVGGSSLIICDIEFAGTASAKNNCRSPICMEFAKTGITQTCRVWLYFDGFNSTDPDAYAYWEGLSMKFKLLKTDAGKWTMYMPLDSQPPINLELVQYHKPAVDDGIKITFYSNREVMDIDLPKGTLVSWRKSEMYGRLATLEQKMAAIEEVWSHLVWDTGGWNPFTETAPASVTNLSAKEVSE